MTSTSPSSALIDDGSHFLKLDKTASVEMFKKGVPLGTGQYQYPAQPSREFDAVKTHLNLNAAFHNRNE
jgi:hypothetical protein